MKVLLVSALPPPAGGMAVWTERFLEYCHKNSIDVDLVNIALIGSRGTIINTKTRVKDEIKRTRRILQNLNNRLDEANPSVVHINSSCGPLGIFRDLLCVRAVKKKKIKAVLHFHCNVENRIRNKIGLWALKRMTYLADQILVLNKMSQRFVAPYSKKAPIIVPNFINEDCISTTHEIRNKVKEIVFVGHVQTTKGIREILKVAEVFPDIHFTLIGPVASDISALTCPVNVSMIGPKKHEEVKQYLIDADLFVFPSYTEGFSLSLTEAMSAGLPSIASDVGANRDMIEDKGGIIVPTKDPNAIVTAINSMSDPQTRKEMSDWSIKKVRENYLTESVMGRLIDLYKEME